MKKILLLSALLLSIILLNAQDNGLSFGVQTSVYRTDFVKSPLVNEKTPNITFAAGFTIGKKINQRFTILGGLSFTSLGDSYYANQLRWGSQHDGEGGFDPTIPAGENIQAVKLNYNYFFFNTRLGLNTYLNEGRFKVFVYPFLESNIYLTNNRQLEVENVDGSIENRPTEKNIITDFRTFNLSAGLGLGLEAALSSKVRLYLMPNTSYMLFGMSKSNPDGARYWNLGATLGVHYNL